jgi:hypothetical protein
VTTDEQALTNWTNTHLDKLDAQEDPLDREIRLQDVAALRARYPKIAKFIHLKRKPGRPRDPRIAAARRDVLRIKKIWKDTYIESTGRCRRMLNGSPLDGTTSLRPRSRERLAGDIVG